MFRIVFSAILAATGATAFATPTPQVTTQQTSASPAPSQQTSVSPAPSQPPVVFEGTHWKLVELGGAPPTTLADVPEAYIQFDGTSKRIAALGGCNRLMGTYAMHGAAISIAAGGMTMMACPDPLGKQELAFTDMLRATKAFRIVGNALELLDGDKVVARFVAVPK